MRSGPGLAPGQPLRRALEQRLLGRRRQAFEVVGDELHQDREGDGVTLGQAELGAGPGPESGDVAGDVPSTRMVRIFSAVACESKIGAAAATVAKTA